MSYSEDILGLQNPDGGWSYGRGGSWTEPTCYASLALASLGDVSSPAVRRAAAWLARCQRSDGGFAPRESVSESVWLTSLVLLLPPASRPALDESRALQWILNQTGRESTWVTRLRMWMLGASAQDSTSFDGWPWFPGAAAWVAPTAFSVLALEKLQAARREPDPALEKRISEGRSFLLARRCRDGGWNHGSTRALGYDSDSYPEATGLALLALHGVKNGDIGSGIRRAEQHLVNARSQEAIAWLEMGLRANGRSEVARSGAARAAPPPRHATIPLALAIIEEAAARGRNVFLA